MYSPGSQYAVGNTLPTGSWSPITRGADGPSKWTKILYPAGGRDLMRNVRSSGILPGRRTDVGKSAPTSSIESPNVADTGTRQVHGGFSSGRQSCPGPGTVGAIHTFFLSGLSSAWPADSWLVSSRKRDDDASTM